MSQPGFCQNVGVGFTILVGYQLEVKEFLITIWKNYISGNLLNMCVIMYFFSCSVFINVLYNIKLFGKTIFQCRNRYHYSPYSAD